MKKLLFLSLSLFAATTFLTAQSGGTNPALIMYRYNSSSTLSPLPVLNGDLLGTLKWNGLVSYGNIGTGATIQSYVTGIGGSNLQANMIFQTSGGAGLTNRMIITSNGLVGINQMTPTYHLDVLGNTHTSGRFFGRIHFDVGEPTDLPNTYNDEAYFERKSRAQLGLAANTYANGGILTLAPGGGSLDRQLFSGGTDGLWTRSQDPLGGNTWAAWQQILTSADINGNVGRVARFTGTTVGDPSSSLGNSQLFDDGTRVGIRNFVPNAGTDIDIAGATRIDGNLGVGALPTTNRLEVAGNSRIDGNLTVDGVSNSLTVNGTTRLVGKVAIGSGSVPTTGLPDHSLYVGGSIITEEVKVELKANWPDYVFEKDYALTPLADVEKFVEENNHLPGIASAKEVAENGLNLGEMQKAQMEKIEEIYLHLIALEKRVNALEELNRTLSSENQQLRTQLGNGK
jgi:hypothetical protein